MYICLKHKNFNYEKVSISFVCDYTGNGLFN